jgi:multiple sugar transport system substrate-binding protein
MTKKNLVRLSAMEKRPNNIFAKFTFMLFLLVCSCNPIQPVTILPTTTKIPSIPIRGLSTPTPFAQQSVEFPVIENNSNPITIEFWHPWSGHAVSVVDALIGEFNSSNPWKIKVDGFSYGNDDYLISKVLEALQDHQNPGVIAAPINFLRNLFINGNEIVDLSVYVNHPKWGLTEEEKLSYPITFWQQDIYDNARYGLPAQRDAHVLFYNQTWAKELGFESVPTTPDDFLNQSCAAARANSFDNDLDNNGTGGWIYNSEPVTVLSWMKAFNGGEIPKNEDDQYAFENQPNIDAFTFLNQIYKLGCAWIGNDPDPYRYFASRKALFYSGTLQDILKQEKKSTKDEWMIVSYPSINGSPVILADGFSYGMLKTTPEKDLAAWLFMRWMQKPENQGKLINETSTYYLTSSALEKIKSFRQKNPTWETALQYLPFTRSVPLISSWINVGRVLQDSGWQLTHSNVKTGDIPLILNQVDVLIKEIFQ